MKTKTVTLREGELLGPIDLNYNFRKHDWGPNKGGANPSCTSEGWELIQRVKVGDMVRCAHSDQEKEVLSVGMYDGWPFWEPTPAIYVKGTMGGEWEFYYNLRQVTKQ